MAVPSTLPPQYQAGPSSRIARPAKASTRQDILQNVEMATNATVAAIKATEYRNEVKKHLNQSIAENNPTKTAKIQRNLKAAENLVAETTANQEAAIEMTRENIGDILQHPGVNSNDKLMLAETVQHVIDSNNPETSRGMLGGSFINDVATPSLEFIKFITSLTSMTSFSELHKRQKYIFYFDDFFIIHYFCRNSSKEKTTRSNKYPQQNCYVW